MNDTVIACRNLGPKEIRKRLLLGYFALITGLILAIISIWLNASVYLRWLLFIPFFVGYLGILQARQKTCVALGIKGHQNLDQGDEPIVEKTLRQKLRRRSVWILIFAGILALCCIYITQVVHIMLPH